MSERGEAMITNYCRRKIGNAPVEYEYAFYAAGDPPAPKHLTWDWVWWRAPDGFADVRLVGESYDTLAAAALALGFSPGERSEDRVLELIERGRLRAVKTHGAVMVVHSSVAAMREGREAAA